MAKKQNPKAWLRKLSAGLSAEYQSEIKRSIEIRKHADVLAEHAILCQNARVKLVPLRNRSGRYVAKLVDGAVYLVKQKDGGLTVSRWTKVFGWGRMYGDYRLRDIVSVARLPDGW